MHIVVIIPNDSWRNTAGVRIRYERIRPWVEAAGNSFSLQSIDEAMLAAKPLGNIYLISKCHDVRAILLTKRLRGNGLTVGVDFFDDYYSQSKDAAFVHLRSWFREMVQIVDFGLCSTPNMHNRLSKLAPKLPLLVMNDPSTNWDVNAVATALQAARKRAVDTKVIDIAWFGIGDNPYFSLGLEDLSAFSDQLLQCRAYGFQPQLRILTNRRALDKRRLEMISRLPIPSVVDEWSEEAEASLISDSQLCVLPVNGQEFSTVKSLNRAVSVLTGGSQVMSMGFPLYEALDPFIYRNLGKLLDDLNTDNLRVRKSTLPQLQALMSSIGSAEAESDRLLRFIQDLPKPVKEKWPGDRTILVMHGNRSSGDIHKQVSKCKYLTIGSPRTTARLNFDLSTRCDPEGAFVDVILRPRAIDRLLKVWKSKVKDLPSETDGNPKFFIRLTSKDILELHAMHPLSAPPMKLQELSRYQDDTILMAKIVKLLFVHPQLYVSETNSPYWFTDMNEQATEIENV